MGIVIARPATFAHPDFKSEKVESPLEGVNHAGLDLVQGEAQPLQKRRRRQGQSHRYAARRGHLTASGQSLPTSSGQDMGTAAVTEATDAARRDFGFPYTRPLMLLVYHRNGSPALG
jgi:hypothetical protein